MLSSPLKVLLLKSSQNYHIQSIIKVFNASYKLSSFSERRTLINYRTFRTTPPLKEEKVTITFLMWDDTTLTKKLPVGRDLREVFDEDEPEIEGFGQCSGCKECGTCHLLFPPELFKKIAPPDKEADDLLIYASEYDPERSRLACDTTITKEMDGAIIKVPKFKEDVRFRRKKQTT